MMKNKTFAQLVEFLEAKLFVWRWTGLALLVATTVAAYANSFFGPFVFDDALSIVSNKTICSLRTAFSPPGDFGLTVGGRPVLNFSFALNWMLGGEKVFGYHLGNLAIHLCSGLLLLGLIERTLRRLDEKSPLFIGARRVAFAAAFIWCLHPLQTESVTYMVQRAESLATLLYLLTVYCFVRSVDTTGKSVWRWQVASVVTCLVGMGAKETVVSAPLFVLLYDRAFVGGGIVEAWRARKRYYCLLGATWGFLIYCTTYGGGRALTAGFSLGVSWWDYLLTQCFAHAHYLRLTFWPVGLTFDYGKFLVTDFGEVWLQGLGLLLAAGFALYALIKRPRLGLLGFGYFSLMAPTTLIPVVTQTISEHRMYFPLAFIILGLVIAVQVWNGRYLILGVLLVGFALAATTFVRNRDYISVDKIWADTLAKAPFNHRAWHAYGQIALRRKDWTAARSLFERSLRVRPSESEVERDLATALVGLGKYKEALACYDRMMTGLPSDYELIGKLREDLALLLELDGRPDEAVAQLRLALAGSADKARLQVAIGHVYARAGRAQECIASFEEAMKTASGIEDTWMEYGVALGKLGLAGQAVELMQKGMAQMPASLELKRSYAIALQSAGRNEESVAVLEECLSQKPNWGDALVGLGVVQLNLRRGPEADRSFAAAEKAGVSSPALYAGWGRVALALERADEAIRYFAKAVEMDAVDWKTRYFLANLLLSRGEFAQAVDHYEKIVAQRPGEANARNELGVAYQELGRTADARREFEAVIKLQPDNQDALGNLHDLDASR